jgi:hypothetical protein
MIGGRIRTLAQIAQRMVKQLLITISMPAKALSLRF